MTLNYNHASFWRYRSNSGKWCFQTDAVLPPLRKLAEDEIASELSR